MDLLPRNTSDFSNESYWANFFSKRSQTFEWYGDYRTLRPLLQRHIRPTEKVLHVGCGNSTLGYDLYSIDNVKQVTNIDLSELVIGQMQRKYSAALAKRDGLQFITMDALQLEFDDQHFNVVLDKGTLDALMVDSKPETVDRVHRMLSECERVRTTFGRHLCVSLLQEHVLQCLIDWATVKAQHNHIVRIQKVNLDLELSDDNRKDALKYPVFLITLIKLKVKQSADKCLFELMLSDDYGAKGRRTLSVQEVQQSVRELQKYALIRHHLSVNRLDEEICLELFDGQESNQFKYRLYVLDQVSRDNTQKMAVFIVPRNRDREFLFGTQEGRQQLAKLCCTQRLVVVHLNANFAAYPPLDVLKQELAEKLTELSPQQATKNGDQKIAIMTVEEQQREILFEGTSQWSGKFMVADVQMEEEGEEEEDEDDHDHKHSSSKYMLRQLIFDSNRNIIQSEARVKLIRNKKKSKRIIDHTYLACSHHHAFLYGFALYSMNFVAQQQTNVKTLLVGLGGGCFASYIQHNLKFGTQTLHMDIVEIDPEMVRVAKEWFSLNETPNKTSRVTLNVIIQDGLEFIAQQVQKQNVYDLIIFDVDNKDNHTGLSCPPPAFIEHSFLDQVASLCNTQTGLFILNLATRSVLIKQQVIRDLCHQFGSVYKYDIPEDINTVAYCFKDATNLNGHPFRCVGSELSEKVHVFEQAFKSIVSIDSKKNQENDVRLFKFVEKLDLFNDCNQK